MGCCSSSADDVVYEDKVIMVDKPSSDCNLVAMQQKGEENPPTAAVEAIVTPVAAAIRTEEVNPIANRACFGAGCYWGTEKFFKYNFGKKNRRGRINNAAVGFMGPADAPDNPTYKEVCGGYTGDISDAPPFSFNHHLPHVFSRSLPLS